MKRKHTMGWKREIYELTVKKINNTLKTCNYKESFKLT